MSGITVPSDIPEVYAVFYQLGYTAGKNAGTVSDQEAGARALQTDYIAQDAIHAAGTDTAKVAAIQVNWVRGFEASVQKVQLCQYCSATEGVKSISDGSTAAILYCPEHKQQALTDLGLI